MCGGEQSSNLPSISSANTSVGSVDIDMRYCISCCCCRANSIELIRNMGIDELNKLHFGTKRRRRRGGGGVEGKWDNNMTTHTHTHEKKEKRRRTQQQLKLLLCTFSSVVVSVWVWECAGQRGRQTVRHMGVEKEKEERKQQKGNKAKRNAKRQWEKGVMSRETLAKTHGNSSTHTKLKRTIRLGVIALKRTGCCCCCCQ